MDLRQSRHQNTRCPAFGCLIACPPDTLLPERNPLLDTATKKRIDDCRDIRVGKVPDPKSQVEQITIALIYKFMDDMDAEAEELGGHRRFFAGTFARFGWAKLMAPSLGGFEVLALYSEAIQSMRANPGVPELFRDIFKNAYLPYRDPETLKSFLKEINHFSYDHSERLGDAFEYLLSVLGSQGDAGQFRTPRHIIDFMVAVVDPQKHETILDPACGTAGFLISAWKHILAANTSGAESKNSDSKEANTVNREAGNLLKPDERTRLAANIKGYDISPDMVRLSLANLYLHGFADSHVEAMNGLLQQVKRAARGFKTAKNFIAIAYLRMSKLQHLPINPVQPTPRQTMASTVCRCL